MRTQFEHHYPWIDDRSAWREITAGGRGRADAHGEWALGNGHVFAVRQGEPFTHLAHLLGPTYARDAHFHEWGSQTLVLRQGDEIIPWERQEAFRVRRTAIIGAELCTADLRLLLIDLAPPDWPVILRAVSIQNIGTARHGGLRLDVIHEGLPDGQLVMQDQGFEVARPERRFRVQCLDHPADVGDAWLRLSLPDLLPDEDELYYFALITGETAEDVSVLAEKLAHTYDRLPQVTYHWWQSWMRETVTVAAEQPQLGDVLDDITISVAVQHAPGGGIAPLATRSVSSAGEELPALRWLLQHGKTDDVRQVLDARYVETCRQQHFAHWLPAVLPPAPATLPEPEWHKLTPPSAWTAAAIVRAHWAYWQQTRDRAWLRQHFAYLHWLVSAQPVSADGLVAYGGDEPFYAPWQRQLPMEAQETLLPDPGPLRLMRHHPWGAAPAMALTAAAEQLAAMAYAIDENAAGHQLNALAATLREATERAYWLAEDGYYAAALSTVDGQLYRLPHLPTALAPLLTGYATRDDPHARDGLDEVLGYLLDTTGLPAVAPDVPFFPGNLLGDLLSGLTTISDRRRDRVYLAALSCLSPAAGLYESYTLPNAPAPNSVATPPATAASLALGITDYLLAVEPTDETLALSPHLPPHITHLHVENRRSGPHRLATVVTQQDDQRRVKVSNTGEEAVRIRLREDTVNETPAYLLPQETSREWTLPVIDSEYSLLPSPREFTAPQQTLPPAPLLVLTVDGDSFADWQHAFHAVMLDAAMPLSPQALASALQSGTQRRYDALYLDVPEVGAAWTGLSDRFWDDPALQQAFATFRDLGGVTAATLFVDSWQIQLPEQEPYEINTRQGWISLPRSEQTVTATSVVPWESADDEEVQLLLYAADGADLEVWVNGERLWRRGEMPEGKRVRIPALLHPGENEFGLRAKRRPGRGFGFCLGIRGQLHWNVR